MNCAQFYPKYPNGYAISACSTPFPFATLTNVNFLNSLFLIIQYQTPKPSKKSKCGCCAKKVNENVFVYCSSCKKIYHQYHFSLKKADLPLPKDWLCNSCSINQLPFSSIADDNFLLTSKRIFRQKYCATIKSSNF